MKYTLQKSGFRSIISSYSCNFCANVVAGVKSNSININYSTVYEEADLGD